MSLISVHKRYKLGPIFLHCFNVNPIFSLCFARTTPIEPVCFDGWNKFSVSIWRTWLPYWTLKEQPHSQHISFTEEKWTFLLRPTFSFGVSSDIIFTRSHLQERDSAHFCIRHERFNLPRKLIAGCMSFSADGIWLRPGEEKKWKFFSHGGKLSLALPRPNPLAARAQNKSRVRSK